MTEKSGVDKRMEGFTMNKAIELENALTGLFRKGTEVG